MLICFNHWMKPEMKQKNGYLITTIKDRMIGYANKMRNQKLKLDKSVVIPRWFLWLITAIIIWFIFQILFKFI